MAKIIGRVRPATRLLLLHPEAEDTDGSCLHPDVQLIQVIALKENITL